MTDTKKQRKKSTDAQAKKTESVMLDHAGVNHDASTEKGPWSKWKVKPDLEPMPASPHESGIGERIAYCRGQLDNLSVDALARYTKFFDDDGVSRASLVRYESGQNIPGARELRILCDALWVPPNWLLLGSVDIAQQEERYEHLDKWFMLTLRGMGMVNTAWLEMTGMLTEQAKERKIEQRQRWLHEARTPQKN